MKLKSHLVVSTFLVASFGAFLMPSVAIAASENECAIWLCAPSGFPSGCGAAKSAMKKRIRKGKSPLPSFSSCAVDAPGGSQMSYTYKYAALIGEHQVCAREDPDRRDSWRCSVWKTVPSHYIKNRRCVRDRDGNETPKHCLSTYSYIDVFVNGAKAGDTYFWQ